MKKSPTLSVIGGGRVGQTLARLGREAGYMVGDVVCASRRSALAASLFIGDGTPLTPAAPRMQSADVIIIATPDDRISQAVDWLLKKYPPVTASRSIPVALHTSGAVSSKALGPLGRHGFAVGSCHPLQTFESPARALATITGSYFCIEGDIKALRVARAFVRRVGARSFEIPTPMKALYHAAAVLASGGVTALLDVSLEALQRCGLDEASAKRVLLPLTETTLANVRAVGTRRALTGPVRRGDVGTVRRNLEALGGNRPEWRELYRLLARQSLDLIASELDLTAAEALRLVLEDQPKVTL